MTKRSLGRLGRQDILITRSLSMYYLYSSSHYSSHKYGRSSEIWKRNRSLMWLVGCLRCFEIRVSQRSGAQKVYLAYHRGCDSK